MTTVCWSYASATTVKFQATVTPVGMTPPRLVREEPSDV